MKLVENKKYTKSIYLEIVIGCQKRMPKSRSS